LRAKSSPAHLGISDGLHLSTEGYAAVWGEYKKLVKTDFKGRGLDWEDVDDLPMRVPL
jgi:hypothetical protein